MSIMLNLLKVWSLTTFDSKYSAMIKLYSFVVTVIHLYCWVVFLCVVVYFTLFTWWWILILFPVFSYCKYPCYKYLCTSFPLDLKCYLNWKMAFNINFNYLGVKIILALHNSIHLMEEQFLLIDFLGTEIWDDIYSMSECCQNHSFTSKGFVILLL